MSKEDKNFKIFERHPCAAEAGGYKIDDKQGLKEQRGIVWDVVKQIGQNLMNGSDLMRTAFPCSLNDPRSYLEALADGWCHAPTFLAQSAATSDPVERLKLVVTFCIAGLHNTITLKKPFNPILGETYQAQFSDGTKIFCEQSSHHPPITSWEVFGPKNAYKMYGYGEWIASFKGNSVRGAQKGFFVVQYPDGTKIIFSLPAVNVGGVLWGDRIIEYDGTITFKDEKNKLVCEVAIPNPHSGGTVSSWFGKQKLPTDHLFGEIQRDGKRIVRVEGSWLGALEFDGKCYWNVKNQKLFKPELAPEAETLPSDCRYREDICLLKKGDPKAAAEAKGRLEEKQRRDAKLRKEDLTSSAPANDAPMSNKDSQTIERKMSKHKRNVSSVN